ncbi:MAG: flagellar hook-basal body complex protein FliE [Pirellulales bacterium]|nr:flagellar hook-basal body complex protein FliE [Pirellulales bacterium]
MNSIQPLQFSPMPAVPSLPDLPGEMAGPTFKDHLLSSIQEVNSAQQQADTAVQKLFTGEDVNPAEVLTAVQKADLAFRMIMQVRNKMVAAYNEIKDIRV